MRSTPSLLALLGLVAVAGYQNRTKISEMLDDAHQRQAANSGQTDSGQTEPGFLSGLSDLFHSGSNGGGSLSTALTDLVNRFASAGHGAAAQSWVTTGPNQRVPEHELATAIGDETLNELVAKTGLSRADLIRRLSDSVPEVVNQLTPAGRLPSQNEAQNLI